MLCSVIAAGIFMGGTLLSHAEAMPRGIAVVTSQTGRIRITNADTQGTQFRRHDTVILHGSTVETGKNARILFVLSNGMGIGIGENAEIVFKTYTQEPFAPNKESLSYEPSISVLSIQVLTGTLVIVSNELSPLSEVRIHLPTGESHIHAATCIIQSDDLGDDITVYKGTITHYYPDLQKREFIIEPQNIRISRNSAKLGEISASITLESLPEAISRFAQTTQIASKRVFFKASPKGQPAQPVLIASPVYFDQPVQRPYEFKQ